MSTASQTGKSTRLKHIPQRTCIGCRKVRPKREMVRIVRTASGTVEVDHTGKKSGRGTYLCKERDCWEAALKKERLDRALKARTSVEDRRALSLYAETLPQPSEE